MTLALGWEDPWALRRVPNPHETETEIQIQIQICDLIGQQLTGLFPDPKHRSGRSLRRSVFPSRGNETNKDFHFKLW